MAKGSIYSHIFTYLFGFECILVPREFMICALSKELFASQKT